MKSNAYQTAKNYLPEQVRMLMRTYSKLEKVQGEFDDLSELVALDIMDGWSTGDRLLDFALVACNGMYDPMVVSVQYRQLHDIGLRKAGERILVVQEAEHYDEDGGLEVLRNMYLGTLRPEMVEYDIDTLTMRIPVNPGHLVVRESIQQGYYVSGSGLSKFQWITIGPLHNSYCPFGPARYDEEAHDVLLTPLDAVAAVYIHPWDTEKLEREHTIDSEYLHWLTEDWMRLRNTKRKSA
jgi:hypothetical protein